MKFVEDFFFLVYFNIDYFFVSYIWFINLVLVVIIFMKGFRWYIFCMIIVYCVIVYEGKIGDFWVGDEGFYYDLEGRIDICIYYILVCWDLVFN